MKNVISGILASTMAASLTYLCMTVAAVGTPIVSFVLCLGAFIGAVVGCVLAIVDYNDGRTQSMMQSTILGGSCSMGVIALGLFMLILFGLTAVEFFSLAGLTDLMIIAASSVPGIAAAITYRLIADRH